MNRANRRRVMRGRAPTRTLMEILEDAKIWTYSNPYNPDPLAGYKQQWIPSIQFFQEFPNYYSWDNPIESLPQRNPTEERLHMMGLLLPSSTKFSLKDLGV